MAFLLAIPGFVPAVAGWFALHKDKDKEEERKNWGKNMVAAVTEVTKKAKLVPSTNPGYADSHSSSPISDAAATFTRSQSPPSVKTGSAETTIHEKTDPKILIGAGVAAIVLLLVYLR